MSSFQTSLIFVSQLAQAVAGLLIILDPLGLLPLVITFTRQLTDYERRQVLVKITLTALLLMIFFAVAGTAVLRLFHISLDDMRIAGGLLLLIIALRIVTEGHFLGSSSSTGGLSVVPLASPLLVGPGAIAAAVVQVRLYGLPITLLAIIISFLICLLVLYYTSGIYRVLGESGSDVISRIMGILLAAIAVNYIREGITGFIMSFKP
jgi:multiple antibiotic resistance protein